MWLSYDSHLSYALERLRYATLVLRSQDRSCRSLGNSECYFEAKYCPCDSLILSNPKILQCWTAFSWNSKLSFDRSRLLEETYSRGLSRFESQKYCEGWDFFSRQINSGWGVAGNFPYLIFRLTASRRLSTNRYLSIRHGMGRWLTWRQFSERLPVSTVECLRVGYLLWGAEYSLFFRHPQEISPSLP